MIIPRQYVSFEIAKLLKAKEYGYKSTDTNYVKGFYSEDGIEFREFEMQEEDACRDDYYLRPEIWEVVEWLRLNHKISIAVDAGINGYHAHYKVNPIGTLYSNLKQGWINNDDKPLSTPQEAYLEAFLYILTDVI